MSRIRLALSPIIPRLLTSLVRVRYPVVVDECCSEKASCSVESSVYSGVVAATVTSRGTYVTMNMMTTRAE